MKWFANLDPKPFMTEETPYLLDKDLAEQFSGIEDFVVLSCEKKPEERKAPAPFITTTLQKAGSIQLGFNAEETMRLAQVLFEKGLITYHRTDNPNLSSEAIVAIQAELRTLKLGEHIAKSPNRWKAKKGAQEAHEAIRPSNPCVTNIDLDPKTQSLYDLIRLRALGSQMAPASISSTTITLGAAGYNKSPAPKFIANGIQTLYAGWRLLLQQDVAEEKLETELQETLPILNPGDCLKADRAEVLQLKTQAPKRYSEPALITKLEKEGIGRPSTYASILSNIKHRGYIELRGKCFEPRAAAETIYDALLGKFKFVEIEYTRLMESALDEIAEGTQEYLTVVSDADHDLHLGLRNLLGPQEIRSCPRCQAAMRKIKGPYGIFWGCSQYTQCGKVKPLQNLSLTT